MTIVLNGQETPLPEGGSLAALLAERRPRPPYAVEVNKRLVRRGEYEGVVLREGDVVEIVTLVGGG